MIDINKRLTENQKDFFNKLSLYIDKPIYFYGSITRDDYIPGKSDIDVDIFTENESSTIHLLCNFLKIKKQDLRKSLYKINNNMVYGYKVKYNDEINNTKTQLNNLQNNGTSIGKFARERYFLKREGEEVYIFEDTAANKATTEVKK